jgi:uncharacterized protein YbaA (DUF1428 family)
MKTNSKRYVDGFVIPIKKKNLRAYKKMATWGCKTWMKHGALDYYECAGDDLKTEWGLTFPKMCKLKSDETAIFAFIVFKSKSHRNAVNAKVMKDPAMSGAMQNVPMPFSMTRFAFGGFKVLVKS